MSLLLLLFTEFMKSKYSEIIENVSWILVVAMICTTLYICVRDINKAQLAKTAIERGVIGVKK